jgi:DNA (cytosine-5)-methyltransferase 1
MENVRNVPNVAVKGYSVQRLDLTDIECGGKQRRLRHLQFGSMYGNIIRPTRTETARPVTPAVLCKYEPTDRHSRRLAAQGAPHMPLRSLTKTARARVVGNAVPWCMATTLARAVTNQSQPTDTDCVCGCGRCVVTPATQATPACRKRMERRRRGIYRTLAIAESQLAGGSQPAA